MQVASDGVDEPLTHSPIFATIPSFQSLVQSVHISQVDKQGSLRNKTQHLNNNRWFSQSTCMWLPRDDIYPEVSAKSSQVDKQGSLRNKTQHLNNNRWFSQSTSTPFQEAIQTSAHKLSRSLVLVVTRRDKCCQLHVSYRTLNTSETLKTVCAARWAYTNDGEESTGTNYARLPVLKLIDTLLEGKGNRGEEESDQPRPAVPGLAGSGYPIDSRQPWSVLSVITADLETVEGKAGRDYGHYGETCRRKDEPPAVEEFGIKRQLGELPQYTAEAGATGELSWQKERPVGEWEKRAPSDRVGRDINQYGWGGITASGSNLLDSRFPVQSLISYFHRQRNTGCTA
ncbi:hypothetical protein RRG08_055039 [Elysia crispata]|uniref:Uncharacterized protein n=1 Tax=Elysia crispata TaxID=231223 RepID=A0AAE1E819_9GAST|nr:hypothetical protein RRG08_055039 [Elysia crispata]